MHEKWYGSLLAKSGVKHLRFLSNLEATKPFPSPKHEYEWAMEHLKIHKKTCSNCTVTVITDFKRGYAELVPDSKPS